MLAARLFSWSCVQAYPGLSAILSDEFHASRFPYRPLDPADRRTPSAFEPIIDLLTATSSGGSSHRIRNLAEGTQEWRISGFIRRGKRNHLLNFGHQGGPQGGPAPEWGLPQEGS